MKKLPLNCRELNKSPWMEFLVGTWADSTNAPVVIRNQFTITNTASGFSQFYRLIK
jgi:hypothetical protein